MSLDQLLGINNGSQPLMSTPGNPAPGSTIAPQSWWDTSWDFLSKGFGTTNNPGFLSMGLGALQGLGNAYMGMKQYGLAKDMFKENKRQFQMNYDAQRKMTNSALADRQRARLAANPNAYQSEAEYMAQYGI